MRCKFRFTLERKLLIKLKTNLFIYFFFFLSKKYTQLLPGVCRVWRKENWRELNDGRQIWESSWYSLVVLVGFAWFGQGKWKNYEAPQSQPQRFNGPARPRWKKDEGYEKAMPSCPLWFIESSWFNWFDPNSIYFAVLLIKLGQIYLHISLKINICVYGRDGERGTWCIDAAQV